jgi:hypothetical protein
MYWNYRIIRLPCEHPEVDRTVPLAVYEHFKYEIHEVYYESDGTPVLRTQIAVGGEHLTAYECEDENPDDLIRWVERILNDMRRREVLDEEEIKYERTKEWDNQIVPLDDEHERA